MSFENKKRKNTKRFNLRIYVKCTHEHVTIHRVTESMKIKQLKNKIEEKTGIPGPRQQLSYLDKCNITEDYTISHFHILPNAKLSLDLFQPWQDIVAACSQANLEKLKEILPLNEHELSGWHQQCLYAAAFVAAHRGHLDILDQLMRCKVNVRCELPSGRHPLSVAISRGHLKCTEKILGRRVRAFEWKKEKVALSDWQIQDKIKSDIERVKQAMRNREKTFTERLTQAGMFDSRLITSIDGSMGKKYLCIFLADHQDQESRKSKPIFRP